MPVVPKPEIMGPVDNYARGPAYVKKSVDYLPHIYGERTFEGQGTPRLFHPPVEEELKTVEFLKKHKIPINPALLSPEARRRLFPGAGKPAFRPLPI